MKKETTCIKCELAKICLNAMDDFGYFLLDAINEESFYDFEDLDEFIECSIIMYLAFVHGEE